MTDLNLEETDKDSSDDSGHSYNKFTRLKERRLVNDELETTVSKFLSKKRPTLCQTSQFDSELDTEDELTGEDDDESEIKVSYETVRDALRDSQDHNDVESIRSFRNQYPKWLLFLSEGFNLLLQGYGSKIALLDDFCGEQLEGQYNYFIIRGYHANLRLKNALESLAEILGASSGNNLPSCTPPSRVALEIRDFCKANDEFDVVLVVYSIDGMGLRSDECQTALCTLAEAPNLRIVASVDHLNAAAMWNAECIEKFRWLSIEAPTYHSYNREILAGGESRVLGLNKKSQFCAHSISSLESVWSSLTENARQIFTIIANRHLMAKGNKPVKDGSAGSSTRLMFWDLYKICREGFLVSYEPALRQQLVEFEDHRLVSRKSATDDGGEFIEVTVDDNVLTDFLQQLTSRC